MKKFLRSPAVQAFLGLMLAGYLILIRRTTRWTHVGLEKVEPTLNSDQGAIGLFWHGRIPLCLGIGQVWWKKPKLRCLVSPSSDGEFIAQALARARFPAIRASSAKKGDSAKARAVVAAFREAMTWVSDGGVLIVTPDGPRGPNEVIASGSLQIAKRTGAPVFLMGLAAAPSIQLDTWDKVMFARPFGRGATVWEGPFHVPRDADDAQIESLIAEWSALLSDATRRAEKLVARRAD
ncbi:lysophospholipid acyltransferase family protein [Phenylobacterium aquaticum]|uniref:lysophospholipid acyltransferase family protein n=1 Tax=Phenylobacterium aquaticum TaxID=1763816 RepID=UPI0026ECD85F|nr:lysophospholipid acyltransferase family protein [Phenylobacterium aquaticum]